MERGLNCVKDVTTLPDGTSPRGEKSFEEFYVAVLLCKQCFSVGIGFLSVEIGLLPKSHLWEFPVARIEFFRMIYTIEDDSISRGITNLKYFCRDWKSLMSVVSDPRVHISTANVLKYCRSVLSWARFTTPVCFEAAGSRVVCSLQVLRGWLWCE